MKSAKKISPAEQARPLIDQGNAIRAEIRQKTGELKDLEAKIIAALDSGEHQGPAGGKCLVVKPGPSIKIKKGDIEAARKILGRLFAKLFYKKEPVFAPVKAFREVGKAVVTESRLKRVLAILEKPAEPYIKWPKAPGEKETEEED